MADNDVFVDLGFRAEGGAVGDDDDEQLYRVTGSKVWMSPTAREWAKHYGMSEAEFAKYLMQRERMREAGMTDADVLQGGDEEADLNVTEI